MATNFEKLVTCSVCTRYHDDPKLLVCDHVFCVACLGLIAKNGGISCPTCRERTVVPINGVRDLKTDSRLKKMVESFRCVDCGKVDQGSKQCRHCHVVVCPTCAGVHDPRKENCELLASIRSVTSKLPTPEEIQTIEELEVAWTIFREKNEKQKNKVDIEMNKLIVSLLERKRDLIKKYDEYDKFAEERLKWLNEAKETEKIVQDLRQSVKEMAKEAIAQAQVTAEKCSQSVSKKKDILTENVPDSLGKVLTSRLQREISNIGNLVLRREAGKDKDSEVVWETEHASVCKFDPETFWPDQKVLAEGKIELVRERGGNYSLRVVDNGAAKWTSETWNNSDCNKPSMDIGEWLHFLWGLEKEEKVRYSMRITGVDKRLSFIEALHHAKFAET